MAFGLDSNNLTAIATAALVVATYQLVRVARSQAAATSVAAQNELFRDFDKDSVRRIRKKIAQRVDPVTRDELLEVLNPIEHIATAVRRGALDLRTVWASSLGDTLFFHIEEARHFMMKESEIDITLFEDSLWFRRRAGLLTWKRKLIAKLASRFHNRFDVSPSRHVASIEAVRTVEADLNLG